jgi:hypothetical protein
MRKFKTTEIVTHKIEIDTPRDITILQEALASLLEKGCTHVSYSNDRLRGYTATLESDGEYRGRLREMIHNIGLDLTDTFKHAHLLTRAYYINEYIEAGGDPKNLNVIQMFRTYGKSDYSDEILTFVNVFTMQTLAMYRQNVLMLIEGLSDSDTELILNEISFTREEGYDIVYAKGYSL